MNRLTDEYRLQAEYCEHMADKAKTRDLKLEWLQLAGSWLALLPYRETAAPRDFDAMTPERGMRQEDSQSSH